jgi:hypothetical protein
MIARATRYFSDSFEAQTGQIQVIDEHTNDPYRTVFCNVVVDTLRKQRGLAAIFAFNEPAHQIHLAEKTRLYPLPSFHTAWIGYQWDGLLLTLTNRRLSARMVGAK